MINLRTKLFKCCGIDTVSLRNFSKRQRVLPAHPSDAEELPVHEYPIKSSKETTIFGWGLSEHGGLGHYLQKKAKMKSRSNRRYRIFKKPFRLEFGEHHSVKDIAVGFGFSAFSVKSKSQVKVFGTGLNTDSQIGYHDPRKDNPLAIILAPAPIHIGFKKPQETKVTGLAAGRAHLVVNTDLEGIFTLGNNSYGQCGRTIVSNEKYSGSRIVHNIPNIEGEEVKRIECGQDHTLFLTESGKVYSCGWGADGQTGLGHYNIECHPQRVLGDIEGETIVKVSSRSDCVLALNDKGEVFGWGNSEYGQIFDKSDLHQQINRPIHLKKCQGFGKIVDVAAAGSYCVMVNDAGEVFTWGFGILGRGPSVSHSWQPGLIPPILLGRNDFKPETRVKSVFCGLNYSGAITNYGDIFTWGKNKDGCLGLWHVKDQYFPLKVFVNAAAKKLALGVDHSLALCHPF